MPRALSSQRYQNTKPALNPNDQISVRAKQYHLHFASDIASLFQASKEIEMADIIHRVGINSPPAAVFAALTSLEGLSDWWTRTVSGLPAAGGELTFDFHDLDGKHRGAFVMSVLEQVPDELVRWKCIEGPSDWVGTEISFRLRPTEQQTFVNLSHSGWREVTEFMGHCSVKWATFLLSLRDLIEEGEGRPAPDDLQISVD